MNPLTELETVLASLAPQKRAKRRRGSSEAHKAFRPTVTIPGARKWYPKLEAFAKTQKIKLGALSAVVKGIALDGSDIRIEFGVRSHTESEFRTAIYRPIKTQFQLDLIKGNWASTNGFQFRLIGGLRIPEVSYSEGKTTIKLPIEIRKTGFFGQFVRAGITDIVCDDKGADVEMSGLMSWLVIPRLVWGD